MMHIPKARDIVDKHVASDMKISSKQLQFDIKKPKFQSLIFSTTNKFQRKEKQIQETKRGALTNLEIMNCSLQNNNNTPPSDSNKLYDMSFPDYVKVNNLQHSLNVSTFNMGQLLENILESPKISKYPNFDSHFECGNLQKVIKTSESSYNLTLRTDYNSSCYQQWFYFCLKQPQSHQKITFKIINMVTDQIQTRGKISIQEALKPCVFSVKKYEKEKIGWFRQGSNISYQINDEYQEYPDFFTFSFDLQIEHPEDTLYIALNYPYTYRDLQKYLQEKQLQQSITTNKFLFLSSKLNMFTLSKLSPNVTCPILCIYENTQIQTSRSSFCQTSSIKNLISGQDPNKKIILIIARQHPGETVSSYVMQGMIERLLNESPDTQFLLKYYTFLIVPMVNVEGVILGNFRCNGQGVDPNRLWTQDFKYPTIGSCQDIIKAIYSMNRKIEFFIDLHGHSHRQIFQYRSNAFAFCCDSGDEINEKIFPKLVSKMSKYFNFDDCRFSLMKEKEKSARGYIHKLKQMPKCYTFETSYAGYTKGKTFIPFTIPDLFQLGVDIVNSFTVYAKYTEQKSLLPDKTQIKEFSIDSYLEIIVKDMLENKTQSIDEQPLQFESPIPIHYQQMKKQEENIQLQKIKDENIQIQKTEANQNQKNNEFFIKKNQESMNIQTDRPVRKNFSRSIQMKSKIATPSEKKPKRATIQPTSNNLIYFDKPVEKFTLYEYLCKSTNNSNMLKHCEIKIQKLKQKLYRYKPKITEYGNVQWKELKNNKDIQLM